MFSNNCFLNGLIGTSATIITINLLEIEQWFIFVHQITFSHVFMFRITVFSVSVIL